MDNAEVVAPESNVDTNHDVRICILQRGNVLVGRYAQDGDQCTLQNASVIRRWGTSKGLGEITGAGPTENTVLDPVNGTVRFHALTVIATLDCKEDAWSAHLN